MTFDNTRLREPIPRSPAHASASQDVHRPLARPEGFAVVELFTSEGCSSCPSADELLSEIACQARESRRPVYALGFHVDYWNSLGWADRFATEPNTARQWRYAQVFGSRQVYTPQMVVNGVTEFVGSDRSRAERVIASALVAEPLATSLAISAEGHLGDESTVTITYAVGGPAVDSAVNIAVVEHTLESDITSGENAGRFLRHDNVVRSFKTIPLDITPGRATLDIPSDLVAAHASIICYVQENSTLRILGAAAVDLVEDEPPAVPETANT
jgi:hypothetical protein